MNIDIVNLIENNPITKSNGNYQSKLIEKINLIIMNNNYLLLVFIVF